MELTISAVWSIKLPKCHTQHWLAYLLQAVENGKMQAKGHLDTMGWITITSKSDSVPYFFILGKVLYDRTFGQLFIGFGVPDDGVDASDLVCDLPRALEAPAVLKQQKRQILSFKKVLFIHLCLQLNYNTKVQLRLGEKFYFGRF